MIYFTADLHLGHKNIIGLARRPFSCIEEMDETLIENWNKTVKGNDTVYILGDLIYKSKERSPEYYLDRLKGKKILILGNHDHGWIDGVDADKYFVRVSPYEECHILNKTVTLCHYPMLEWRNSRKEGSKKLGYLIHGHVHRDTERGEYMHLFTHPNALNAGVDVNNFCPVPFGELSFNNSIFKHEFLKGKSEEQILFEREMALVGE